MVFAGACTNDEVPEITIRNQVKSRGVIEDISTTNPDLINDWEHQEKITLSNGELISLPWTSGTSISSSEDFVTDIKKEDGWIMLFHTFKELNSDRYQNYMFFYNNLTGFIKVFYYNEIGGSNQNGAMWHFHTMNGMGNSFFNLNNYIALTEDATDKASEVSISNGLKEPVNGFSSGWNGFELEVPYTPNYENLLFALGTYNRAVTSYTFSGTSETSIEGTIVKNVQKQNGLFETISTIGGWGAKQLIGKMKKKVDDKLEKDTTGVIKAQFGTKVVNALASLSQGNIKSALSAGLKFIFGSSTATEIQKVNLTAKGEINLTGNSITTSTGAPFPIGLINLYNIVNNKSSVMNFDASYNQIVLPQTSSDTASEVQWLGVWTLPTTPIVYLSRYSKVEPSIVLSGYIQKGSLFGPYRVGNQSVDVVVNPNLAPYITKKTVSSELVYAHKLEGYNESDYYFKGLNMDLIYSDRLMDLRETPINKPHYNSYLVAGCPVPIDYDYFFDWGTQPPKNMLMVITVDLTYNYQGKTLSITSSRTYKAKCAIDTSLDRQILQSGKKQKAYVVNTGSYPLENRSMTPFKINTEMQKAAVMEAKKQISFKE